MTDIDTLLTGIGHDERRNDSFLHLTANENVMSDTARRMLASRLAERYYFGGGDRDGIVDFGVITAVGLKGIEALAAEAERAACAMLHASAVNLNVLSGVHAMMSAILSTTEPGDLVMTVAKEHGGHFATKGILERVGRRQAFLDFDLPHLRFDTEAIAKRFRDLHATAIYLDVSYYLNPHNLRELRSAVGNKAVIIYDASHTMGLIMGGIFQAPLLEGADVMCANTHKTLPGPHKGMIAFKDARFAERANGIINGCLYSSPHATHVAALAVAILEMRDFGAAYARQIVANSNALGEALQALGYDIRIANTGRISETHQVHAFLDKAGDRLTLFRRMLNNHLTTNFDNVLGGRLFARLGTAEPTHRGMKEADMREIARFLDAAWNGKDVSQEVAAFNDRFRSVAYSYDTR